MTWDATALVDAARRAGVRDPRVLEALARVDRRRFVPPEAESLAGIDEPIPIGHGQVTTQPSLVAMMVEALELPAGARVLEIGTGLGYQAAILGTLAREVYSIERLDDLADRARANLRAAGFDNAVVLVGGGTLGLPAHAPYDAIVVAAAAPVVPAALVDQLVPGGRLVQPMGTGGSEVVAKFRRRGGELVREADIVEARFVPLIAGPTGAFRVPDFNLLVSTLPLAARRARREVEARMRSLTGEAPEAMEVLSRGMLAVRVVTDPREVVARLRALGEREPQAFRFTRRWVPVDVWTRPELPAMKEAVARLRSRIGPDETWRMTVERRSAAAAPATAEVIRALAELIDAPVNLDAPNWILLVQLFADRVALSIVAPHEVFSVAKLPASRAPAGGPLPGEASAEGERGPEGARGAEPGAA